MDKYIAYSMIENATRYAFLLKYEQWQAEGGKNPSLDLVPRAWEIHGFAEGFRLRRFRLPDSRTCPELTET